jgi:predicted PurR-regulated permease PerM
MQVKDKGSITGLLKILTLLLLLVWCFSIVKPFILIVVWAIVLAVALYPLYKFLVNKIGEDKKKLVTVIFTLGFVFVFLTPAYFLTKSLATASLETIEGIKNQTLEIPSPNETVKDWPLIGEDIYNNWSALSTDVKKYTQEHEDVILEKAPTVFSGIRGFIGAFFMLLISFIISVVFMYNSKKGSKNALLLIGKLTGTDGKDIVSMSRDVIRSVVKGVLLVALIQTGLAFIGFKAIGLPAAGVFTFLILVSAIIQIPALLTMIPAMILAFSIADTTPAIIFSIYCVLVGISDNFLKPMLLGKGLSTPMIVILLGTIGGMLLHGIIGLFIGPVVLAVMYRLYEFWVNSPENG